MITESWTEDRLLDRLFSFHDQTGAGLCTMPLSRNTRGISPTVGKFEFFLKFSQRYTHFVLRIPSLADIKPHSFTV